MSSKKKPWRRFLPNTPLHHYQRSGDGGILFYDEILILEHFMLFCTNARIYDVTVLAITYMLTHLHGCCMAVLEDKYIKCLSRTSEMFSTRVRFYWHHSWPLFDRGLEYAIKPKAKSVRSCLNYIANNAPEKKLCRFAIDYRWNFLKYAQGDHPFSSPYIASKTSKKMRVAHDVISRMRAANEVPSIDQLVTFRKNLISSEWQQLVDYMITQYSVIDYDKAASYFGSVENMITAPDSNIGEEHDISELYDTNSYVPYYDLCKVVYNRNTLWNPFDKKSVVNNFQKLLQVKSASTQDIASFLHVREEDVEEMIMEQDMCRDEF